MLLHHEHIRGSLEVVPHDLGGVHVLPASPPKLPELEDVGSDCHCHALGFDPIGFIKLDFEGGSRDCDIATHFDITI
jgi:hypothetical protein